MAEVAPPIMSKNALKLRSVPKRGYFAVSLEIRPADGAPLVLATRIVEQWSETAFGPFQVYDVLLDDGLIVVAVSSGDIDLWRVAPFGDPRVKWPPIPPLPTPENAKLPIEFPQISTATLPGGDWSRVALASSRDATQVSLKLSLTGDGRVQADVVDLRVTPDNLAAGETPNTRFIQRGDEWRFDVPRK
jgi:hypothetical protein